MSDDKFILMDMDDERSKKIAEVLGNKTCKKIIDYLSEVKEASEKDIATALSIPINTVEYNLKKLIESGLVEKTKNFFWSVKGRKIDMFKLAKKHIIISPKSKRVDMTKLKTILPVIFIAAVLVALILIFSSNPGIEKNKATNEIKQFSSIDELKNFLKASSSNMGYSSYSQDRMANGMMAPTAGLAKAESVADSSGAGSGAATYSHTNIQVEGVDEADIVKNDGKYIYTLSGDNIIIVNAYPAGDMKILSKINASSAQNLFINGDRLVVFGNSYVTIPYSKESASSVRCLGCGYGEQRTFVYIYNIKDRENPILEKNMSFDGSYTDSRMINDYVYLISSKYANYDQPIPYYSINGVSKSIPLSSVYYFDYPDNNYAFSTISAINVNSNEVNSEVYLLGSSQTQYVSLNNIYITYQKRLSWEDNFNLQVNDVYLPIVPDFLKEKINEILVSGISGYEKQIKIQEAIVDYSNSLKGEEKSNFDSKLQKALEDFQLKLAKESEKTVVHKINIDKDKITYLGSGDFPGHLLNQFSMDEYNGYFRAATTTGESWQGNSGNNVYVLDSDLKVVGTVENLAPGEKIYSVRFLGDRAYIVTFKSIDPLFVIDLTSPQNPKVLGYLKIPGYSDYLHPYDETHIIGIGKDVNESIDADKVHSAGAVYYTAILGLKISMFDVSDFENPKEVSKVIIGERGTDSPALYDHKAFLFDKEKGIIVIPVSETRVVNRTYQWGSYEESEQIWQGAYVLNVNANEISVRGKITHNNETGFEKLGPAKDEPLGAERKDSSGNIWIKFNVLNGLSQWRTNATGYGGVVYSDYEIDSFPGGTSFRPYFDYSSQIQRSLFMDNVLYTISQTNIKANDLVNLSQLNSLDLGYPRSVNYPILYSSKSGGVAVPAAID
ncbi:Beta propeller domain protein [uncultured archaeon]|nr:Beta propeller domain protein [uncultured archaeon]